MPKQRFDYLKLKMFFLFNLTTATGTKFQARFQLSDNKQFFFFEAIKLLLSIRQSVKLNFCRSLRAIL